MSVPERGMQGGVSKVKTCNLTKRIQAKIIKFFERDANYTPGKE